MGIHTRVGFAMLFLLMSEIVKLCFCSNSNITCIERERQALLKFKASFSDPSKRLFSTWEGNDCCQWRGIGCNKVAGHVISLNLSIPRNSKDYSFYYTSYNYLNHERTYRNLDCYEDSYNSFTLEAQNVDPSILQLKHLTYLDLSGTCFNYSPIPMFLGSMTQLTYLSLFGAGFSGTIPQSLGNLTKLRHLDLSFNYLYAEEISWISQLSSLQYLDMSGVDLGKASNLFQVLNVLPSLLHIHLVHCELASSSFLHHHINFTNLTKIEVLDLSSNALQAPFLDAFQNMTSISVLYLYNTNIDSLPLWLGKFNNLVELYFQGNILDGQFPLALQNLTSIKVLDLSSNNLSSMPSWLANFNNLVHLDLSGCQFQGSIPHVLRSMTSLTRLDLSSNNLSSVVPSWLVELKSLVYLNLEKNQLKSIEGSLSLILRNMCSLKVLDLSSNSFQGEAFETSKLYGCTKYNLQTLSLLGNKFNDTLPNWLGHLKNLRYFYLASNSFSSSIPSSLGKLSNLRELDLSSNRLNGTIPHGLGKLANLQFLFLDDNHLDGVFPDFLAQLQNLSKLDLSHNNFYGPIPASLGQLINLWRLDLSSNYFIGAIPPNLGQLVNLQYLNLSRNNLQGRIPNSFAQLVNLFELDLSSNSLNRGLSKINDWSQMKCLYGLHIANNHIKGQLPENISNVMPGLVLLFLGNNQINGSIPQSLCKTEYLSSLDLSNNTLSGEIPDCWKDGLVEINLSSNNLSGHIPSSIMNMSSLSWLHLNKNNLQGQIPFFIKNSEQLVILDLGENQLSNVIPSWTGNMFPVLQILRLRQNKLNGTIPSQLCQLSALKILDVADNNLMGSIPSCVGNLLGMRQHKSSNKTTRVIDLKNLQGKYSMEKPPWNDNEGVKEVMKGREYEYTKNLKFLVNMDFSSNNLVGLLPEGMTLLTGLQGLHLSHNNLSGKIPRYIGNMKSLESFDVSYNKFSGGIPNTMSTLTSLSHLNLSYNNFSGPIPTENQFLTLDDPYNYIGNPLLYRSSLPKKCTIDGSHQVPSNKGYKEEDGRIDDSEKVLFYFVIAVGFATGFWGVIGVLLIKKRWRHACFRWVDNAVDNLYVAIFVNVARLKRKMLRNNV